MNGAFILRYQETARPTPDRYPLERNDKLKDQSRDVEGVILAGTKTLTEVTGEAADADPSVRSLRIIPC